MQRRRADIRDYLNEDTEFPGDRLFRDAPYTLSPGYRALLDDAIAYASDRVAGAAGRREQRVAWWSAIALLRSLVSSPRAAAQTLVTRSQSAAATTADEADVLGRPVTADMADDNPDGIDASPGADEGQPRHGRSRHQSRRTARRPGMATTATRRRAPARGPRERPQARRAHQGGQEAPR